MAAKRILNADITGERGIALIHTIVSEMGFLWYPTGGVEAGIDGTIEIRDPATGAVTNCIVQVQSKATAKPFDGETDEGLTYYCDQEDLDYWFNGNAPVILVRSRPETHEAYWISIKDYFKDPQTRVARKIRFDKTKDRFDKDCAPALVDLAVPRDFGLYLAPPPRHETLISNLLPLTKHPERIYIADTVYTDPKDLSDELRRLADWPGHAWTLKAGRIVTFHNLREYPYNRICDQGTIESYDAEEWALTHDDDTRRDFVALLNQALRHQLGKEFVRWDKEQECYHFRATPDLSDRKVAYQSLQKRTSRLVFQGYPSKSDPTRIQYYRHSAFKGQWQRFDQTWYLEINPTQLFTSDGVHLYKYHDQTLSGLKRMELQPAIRGQVIAWAAIVSKEADPNSTKERLLEFGSLATFEINAGVNDRAWVKREESEKAEEVQAALDESE